MCIYRAILDGWTVRYYGTENTFVFTKAENEVITTAKEFLETYIKE